MGPDGARHKQNTEKPIKHADHTVCRNMRERNRFEDK